MQYLFEKEVVPSLQNLNAIAHTDNTFLKRRDLHAQTGRLTSFINNPVLPHCSTRLIAICDTSCGIDVRQLAASGPARDV